MQQSGAKNEQIGSPADLVILFLFRVRVLLYFRDSISALE
jgi:hypothetical protein